MTQGSSRSTDERQSLLRAYLAIRELEAKLSEAEQARKEGIAIIGMGCRFPQAANPEEFWDILERGIDATCDIPETRWEKEQFYHPASETPGKVYTWRGGYLEDISEFDSAFWGISRPEAMSLDPQQRLLLEVAWEALEDACIDPLSLKGSRTGVFTGLMNLDYPQLLLTRTAPEEIDSFFGTGSELSFSSGRLAYILGLRGPSLIVGTACSSSLVAIHLASQSLRMRECNLALAGGVNIISNPHSNIALCRMNALSRDGRCKAFDASADGYGRGEGCGVTVLKRLSDALRDNDRILAVIKGSAINHGGASAGLTVPSGPAQAELLREACQQAGVDPVAVEYLEAHGTGTSLGDPIELNAIHQVYGSNREQPLIVGSVKSNIAHLEAAAGVAGLQKIVLALQNQIIPRHLHFTHPNPLIPWKDLQVTVPVTSVPWPKKSTPRQAALSSFGLSGVNAHLIIEEPPPSNPPTNASTSYLLCLSAKSELALRAMAIKWSSFLATAKHDLLPDICFSAAIGRSAFMHRLALISDSSEDLSDRLKCYGNSIADERVRSRQVSGPTPQLAFLFSDITDLHIGAAKELYQTEAVFRETFDSCVTEASQLSGRPLLRELFPEPGSWSRLDEPVNSYTTLFCLQIGLTRLYESLGLRPDAVLGYGIGELAAAVTSGILEQSDALRLLIARGLRVQETNSDVATAIIHSNEEIIVEILSQLSLNIALVAIDLPDQVKVAGHLHDLKRLVAFLEREGIQTELLRRSDSFPVNLGIPAFHSLVQALERVSFRPPTVDFYSCGLGKQLSHQEAVSQEYWHTQLTGTVRFSTALSQLREKTSCSFLEIGPGSHLIKLCAASTDPTLNRLMLSALRPEREDDSHLLDNLRDLWLTGHSINWPQFYSKRSHSKMTLPTYPFSRTSCWHEALRRTRSGLSPASDNSLLGTRLQLASASTFFQAEWGPRSLPYLADHRVYGQLVVPGATFFVVMLAATGTHSRIAIELIDSTIASPLILRDSGSSLVQSVLSNDGSDDLKVEVFSESHEANRGNHPWVLHCAAKFRAAQPTPVHNLAPLTGLCTESVATDNHYSKLSDLGLSLGRAFRWLVEIRKGDQLAIGKLRNRNLDETRDHPFHPGQLDACFQLVAVLTPSDPLANDLYLPLGINRLVWVPTKDELNWCSVELKSYNAEVITVDAALYSLTGEAHLIFEGLHFRKTSPRSLSRVHEAEKQWLHRVIWQPIEFQRVQPDQKRSDWLLLSENSDSVSTSFDNFFHQESYPINLPDSDSARDENSLPETHIDSRLHTILQSSASSGFSPKGVVLVLPPTSSTSSNFVELESLHLKMLEIVRTFDAVSWQSAVWFVTTNAQPVIELDIPSLTHAGVWGLVRCLQAERPSSFWGVIDLPLSPTLEDWQALGSALNSTSETQIAVRVGSCRVPRLVSDPNPDPGPYEIVQQQPGLIDSLTAVTMNRGDLPPNDVEIQVDSVGLNFRDVLNVLGLYPGDAGPLGGECAGTILRIGAKVSKFQVGQPVVALARGCLRTHVIVSQNLVVHKPPNLTFDEAASIPVAFLTAQISLRDLAKLQPGERVLIHGASGGVGLAGIQVAKNLGAEIFASAGTEAKRAFLRSLGINHVFDSRSLSFDSEIRERAGDGIHVILNTLTGPNIIKGLQLLAIQGRFIEIGKTEIWTPSKVHAIRPDVFYSHFALDELTLDDPLYVGEQLELLMDEFSTGSFHPTVHHTYSFEHASQAFRLMSQSRHRGKIVLRRQATINTSCGTILITGGLGGLGLSFARGLIKHGFKHLVLLSRRAPTSDIQKQLDELNVPGSAIRVLQCDVSNYEQLRSVADLIEQEMPPLRGVIHSAGVLADDLLERQTQADVLRVFSPKVRGAWNLHCLTRDLPLSFFVLCSSASYILGSVGQSAYAAANAFLAALAHRRRSEGLAALAVDWGPWAGDGMAAAFDRAFWESRGITLFPPDQGTDLLLTLLTRQKTESIVLSIDWPTYLKDRDFPIRNSLLSSVGQPESAFGTTQPAKPLSTFLEELATCDDAEKYSSVTDFLQREVHRFLGVDKGLLIEPTRSLQDLGLDSLMAIELRNTISTALQRSLPATLLFNYPTIQSLADHLCTDVLHLPIPEVEPQDRVSKEAHSLLSKIESISDDEVDRLLNTMLTGNDNQGGIA